MDIKKKGMGIFIAAIFVISVLAALLVTATVQQKQVPPISERRGGAL